MCISRAKLSTSLAQEDDADDADDAEASDEASRNGDVPLGVRNQQNDQQSVFFRGHKTKPAMFGNGLNHQWWKWGWCMIVVPTLIYYMFVMFTCPMQISWRGSSSKVYGVLFEPSMRWHFDVAGGQRPVEPNYALAAYDTSYAYTL